MTFDEVLAQVKELLQREQRVSYRGLKRRFVLDDEYLEDLKEELIGAKRLAIDEDGRFLVWTGASPIQSSESTVQSSLSLPHTSDTRLRTPRAPSVGGNSELSAAERRQLTVMFCDLVDSTALSSQLDPEELRAVVREYQDTCTAAIRRYDGHIAQHLGDGLLVYFGYPVAHEDDAARAVRAGLEILEALRLQVPSPFQGEPVLPAPVPQAQVSVVEGGQGEGSAVAPSTSPYFLPKGVKELHVRIGIHTGLVVIGEIGSSEKREILALGETPNLAARIQGQANRDEVMISAATYRLVEGLFVCEDRGQPELKGIATPLTLYRIAKESEAHSRFEVVVRKGLTPLIGREHEYGLLHERWQRVKDGAGQAVLLSGEPGIGKSRLVEALKEHVEHEGSRCLELRCSPYAQNSALAPVIEHLQRVLQFQPNDTPEEKLQKLEHRLSSSPLNSQETAAFLASLLSLPASRFSPPALSPQKQKEKTQEALVAWLCAEAKHQAVTYAWEDLHWADPSTLELLTLFLQQVPTTRLLTVLTYRPEFIPPWGSPSYLSQLTLSRLAQSHVEVMVDRVTGGKALPAEIVRQIASKTDGVPLFVEELTKMVVESSLVQEVNGHYELTGSLPSLAIPSTLQDSLMARLDRLGTAKEIAQLGATLGREFSHELLHAVAPLKETVVQEGLAKLVDAELLYQRGLPLHATYTFKHALIQDTAYQSLLKSTRQQYHKKIAQVLEEQFPETKETQPELLAHHYTDAGLTAQAIPYWQQAGQQATQRSANAEAIGHLTKGLEVLKTLPDTPERIQQELTLQIALGGSLMTTKGYAAPEVGAAYTRARDLCRHLGESSLLFPVLWRLHSFYITQGEFQTAREFADQLLAMAQRVQDSALLLEAHATLGDIAFFLGEFSSAQEHLEYTTTLYVPQQHHSLTFLYGINPKVAYGSHAALTLWLLGYPDRALRKSQEALIQAEAIAHPYSRVITLGWAAFLHQHRWDVRDTQEKAEAALALSIEQGFPVYLAWGTLFRGWALAAQGQTEEGIAQIHQGLAVYRLEVFRPYFLALLAQVYGKRGQVKEGLAILAEALVMGDKTGQRFYEAELYRLKGELTLQSQASLGQVKTGQDTSEDMVPRPLTPDSQSEAEACFLNAIEVARSQQAKSLELRAATSLARLWQQQSKQAEAHKLLSEVYNWFTEGFETKDLQEAKALLEKLS